MALGCKRSEHIADLSSEDSSSRVHDVAELKSVELARGAHSVGTHVVETEPVSHLQPDRKLRLRANAVDRVACRTPDAAELCRLVLCDMERSSNGKHVWVNDLVIEKDAVESTVDAVIDIVYSRTPKSKGQRVRKGERLDQTSSNTVKANSTYT